MDEKILVFLRESKAAFWVGFIGGGVPIGNYIFADAILIKDLIFVYAIKLFAAIVLAFFSGFATVAGNHFFKHKFLNKKQTNEEPPDEQKIEEGRGRRRFRRGQQSTCSTSSESSGTN